jgi:hypothetical protein
MRCREALLAFADAAQTVLPWTSTEPKPKQADLRAWADHICPVTMAGDSHKERRHLFKNQLESAWSFANWLTHAKGSKWHDAEAAIATTEDAIGLCTSSVIRHMRGVPRPARPAARIACRPSADSAAIFPISSGNAPPAPSAIGLANRCPFTMYPNLRRVLTKLRLKASASFRPCRSEP